MTRSELFILAEREDHVRNMDAAYLANYLKDGYSVYATAGEADAGRRAGDAYDEPGRTRVVGFRVEAFLPRKKGKRK